MRRIRDFNIDIYKLKDAEHSYRFDFDDSFFTNFEHSLVEKGNGRIELLMDKKPTYLRLDFDITGEVELTCDRTLKKFLHPLEIKKSLLLKFSEEAKEIDDEIEFILWDTQTINVAQYIYEFIGLSIPMRKLHPDHQDDDDIEKIIFSTKETKGTDQEDIDPRWDSLKNLKN